MGRVENRGLLARKGVTGYCIPKNSTTKLVLKISKRTPEREKEWVLVDNKSVDKVELGDRLNPTLQSEKFRFSRNFADFGLVGAICKLLDTGLCTVTLCFFS